MWQYFYAHNLHRIGAKVGNKCIKEALVNKKHVILTQLLTLLKLHKYSNLVGI